MSKKATLFIITLMFLSFSLGFGQTFSDDFEDGDVVGWQQYRLDEEMIESIDMSAAPAELLEGDDKVGYIRDVDYSYSGAAILLTGDAMDANYTVESYVYVYENAAVSAYTGIVAYADSSHQGPQSHGYYVKLVADFDSNNRFRLYNNQLDMSIFDYTFSHSIDASGVDKTEGWHHFKVVVTTNEDNSVSYQCFYDEIDLGTYVDDSEGHTTMGQAGVFAFQQNGTDGLAGYFDNFMVTPSASSMDFVEDFEDGDVSDWEQYRLDEEMIQSIDMSEAPAELLEGDDKVGYIRDIDYSYSGAAILLTGNVMDANYTVESYVYVYENAAVSAYTGIVAYADSSHQGPQSHGYYVKLVADFDSNNRFRLYNNQLDMSIFDYTFSHSIDASGVDKTEGWHHFKVVVTTNEDNSVSYQCFYDEIDLGTYVDDSEGHTTMGQAGVFAFQQNGTDGLAGYFDNFMVSPNGQTAIIEREESARPVTMTLDQNYPNPFNPTTTISFDMSEGGLASLRIVNIKGETITTLAQGHIQPGRYQLLWDGRNDAGQLMATGTYIAVLSRGSEQITRSMLLLK
jgi:predicted SnoaL-like aldol condensation-catalyzing enzyme